MTEQNGAAKLDTIKQAVAFAIKEMGMVAFKKTSLFLSNEMKASK